MRWLVCLGLVMPWLPAVSSFGASVELTWTANTEADLAGYKLYHAAGASCPAGPLPLLLVEGKPVVLPKDAVKYTHTVSSLRGEFCYELTAFDTSGNESGRSNRAAKVFSDLTPPTAPTLRLGPVRP